ncbi:hypothetical protein ACHAQH_008779 [Verticillium albo-atrum]
MHKLVCLSFLAPVALAAAPHWPRVVSSPGPVSESASLGHPSRIAESDPAMRLLSPTPQFLFDTRASPFCTWWFNYEGAAWDPTCEGMPDAAAISPAQWHAWNPIIAESCDNYRPGNSYCIEAFHHPMPTTQPPTTTAPPPTTTTTTASNGITTPRPNQPGMTANCNKFHVIRDTTTCQGILDYNKISRADFVRWNPNAVVGTSCDNLVLGSYACVGEIGHSPTAVTTQPPTTTTTNGITTPTPNQPGMDTNCNKFHLIRETTTCQGILDYNKIIWSDFLRWNPGVGINCQNLWLNTYACVGVIGGSTPPATTTTTRPSNGVTTPTPNQPGMATNCNKFHLIRDTTTCAGIVDYNKITLANFLRWNPNVGSNCQNLQLGTYACAGVIGGTPTPTSTGNGVSTPTPNQPGIVTNCNKFHLIRDTTTCQGIVDYNGITMANFLRWNTGVVSNCGNLWLGTYACVGVIGGGGSAPTPTTKPGGVSTPTPTQAGMVRGCTKFHHIRDTTLCANVLTYNSITLAQFFRWNPAVGSNCQNLWANTHACVAGP